MEGLFNYISKNKTDIPTYVSIVVGIATVLTSIATIIVAVRQNKISAIQNQMQDSINQPVFDIRYYQIQDKDDGLYGTTILDVNNVGQRVLSCDVMATAFFCLSKNDHNHKDTVIIKIDDYFYVSTKDSSNPNNIKHCFCPGNNRVFCTEYRNALNDPDKGDALFFFDEILLVKVDYTDVFNKQHTLYFDTNKPIDKVTYQHYFIENQKYNEIDIHSLNKISYRRMKDIINSLR